MPMRCYCLALQAATSQALSASLCELQMQFDNIEAPVHSAQSRRVSDLGNASYLRPRATQRQYDNELIVLLMHLC